MLRSTATIYRNAYSGLSKETWLLSLVMLLNRSGTMVIPFMTLYLTSSEMGYSIGQAGIVFGLFGLGAFTGAYFGGKLTDKIGFYPVQMLTLIGGGILFLVLGQMKTYPLICLFTFLLSFVNEAFRPANSTAIAFYSKPGNRTRSYSLNRLAINLGWALGSALGGLLADINYEILFWVDGFTNISAAILMWAILKPTSYKKEKEEHPQVPAKSAYRDRTYLAFIVITMVFAMCFFQMFTNLPVFFKNNFHFSKPYIGALMAVNGIIIAMVEMVLVYRLEAKKNFTVYIVWGVALVGVSLLLLNIPGPASGTDMLMTMGLLMIALITFGEILSMPFMNTYWISRSQDSNRGQYAALYTMAWSAAQCLGPLLGAQIAERFGFHWLWYVTGALSLLAAYSFWWLNKRQLTR